MSGGISYLFLDFSHLDDRQYTQIGKNHNRTGLIVSAIVPHLPYAFAVYFILFYNNFIPTTNDEEGSKIATVSEKTK